MKAILTWTLCFSLFLAGTPALANQDIDWAEAHYQVAKKVLQRPASNRAQSFIRLGQRSWRNGDVIEAEYYFIQATRIAPNYALGFFTLGHLMFWQGRYVTACDMLKQGMVLNPSWMERSWDSLSAFPQSDEFLKRKNFLAEWVAKDSKSVEARFLLLYFNYSKEGDLDDLRDFIADFDWQPTEFQSVVANLDEQLKKKKIAQQKALEEQETAERHKTLAQIPHGSIDGLERIDSQGIGQPMRRIDLGNSNLGSWRMVRQARFGRRGFHRPLGDVSPNVFIGNDRLRLMPEFQIPVTNQPVHYQTLQNLPGIHLTSSEQVSLDNQLPRDLQTWYPTLVQISNHYQLDPRMLAAIIYVESRFDPQAVSHAGAQGMMQLIPATARRFGVRDSFDPLQNIHGGAQYFRMLLNMFGNPRLALAAYNAGEQNVLRYQGVPPFDETQNYVEDVLDVYSKLI